MQHHPHADHSQQSKPDPNHPDQFPGSTFAPNVTDGAPTTVAGRVTAPDERGGCRYTATEDYYNDKGVFPHGPPADACHKFLTHGTIAAFEIPEGTAQFNSIDWNTGSALLFSGIGYGANSVEPQIAHVLGSPHNALLMSDCMAFPGPGKDGTPAVEVNDALIAYWKQHSPAGKPYYPRTPFAVATDKPKPLGT